MSTTSICFPLDVRCFPGVWVRTCIWVITRFSFNVFFCGRWYDNVFISMLIKLPRYLWWVINFFVKETASKQNTTNDSGKRFVQLSFFGICTYFSIFSWAIGHNLRVIICQYWSYTRSQKWRLLFVQKWKIPTKICNGLRHCPLLGHHMGSERPALSGNLHPWPVPVTSTVSVFLVVVANFLLSRVCGHRVTCVQGGLSCRTNFQVCCSEYKWTLKY